MNKLIFILLTALVTSCYHDNDSSSGVNGKKVIYESSLVINDVFDQEASDFAVGETIRAYSSFCFNHSFQYEYFHSLVSSTNSALKLYPARRSSLYPKASRLGESVVVRRSFRESCYLKTWKS